LSRGEQLEQLKRQNQTLVQTLATMGARLESSLKLLSAISSLTAVPLKPLRLAEAAGEVLEILVRELDNIDGCSLLFFSPEEQLLKLLAARGQSDLLGLVNGPYNTALAFQPGEGVAGRVFLENEPKFWDKYSSEAGLLKLDPQLSTPESLACLPLSLLDRQIGVLNISFGSSKPFDYPRKRDLILLSGVVANVIQTFVLKEELHAQAAFLQDKVWECEKEIAERQRIEEALARARDELEERVQARTAEVLAANKKLKEEITERRRAAQALAESEERYRSLVERTSDGFFIFEAACNRLVFVNRRMCDLFGYSMDEALGLTVADVVASEQLELAEAVIRQRIEDNKPGPERYLFAARRKDGSTFQAEASISAVNYKGNTVIQGVIRDVTEEERLKNRLLQTHKLEAMGTLAGGIAHDFNNILSAIMGYTELLENEIPEASEASRYLEHIKKAGLRARDLVKQILAFSRRTETEKRPTKVAPIIEEALQLLRASLPTTIEIRRKVTAGNDTVQADPSQIHQMVMNLGTNAGQAMRDLGGVLEVTLSEEDLAEGERAGELELKPGPYLKLTVRDTGIGMEPEIVSRIFEPFFSTRKKDEGTGLGLAVVHGIVQTHGGAVTVASEPGRGTVFEVYLPQIEKTSFPRRKRASTLPMGSERILLVDDEEDLVEVFTQTLENLGYHLTARTSAPQALGAFRARPDKFDLVITDQTMPKMTGLELVREIKRLRPDIPVILYTGFSEEITPDKAAEAGISALLMKPLTASEMAKTVRRVLDKPD